MGVLDFFSSAAQSATKGLFDGIAGIIGKVVQDPNAKTQALVDLQKLQASHEENMQNLSNALETEMSKQLETVNQTMREEGKSEHWAQWLWRPCIGFTFCLVLINNYVVIPYFPSLKVIVIPDNVWTAILVILGAASAGRGLTQWQQQKNKS